MSLSRCVCLRRMIKPNKYPIGAISRRYKSKEILAETSPSPDSVIEHPKFFEEILDVQLRQQRRKPKIEPFAKSLFSSQVNTELLAYPEVLDKEELLALDNKLDKIDSVIGDLGSSNESLLETFKTQRIFGAPLTVFQGGLESNYTERMRFLEEISRLRTNVALQLNTQWAGIEAIKSAFTVDGFDTIAKQLSDGNHPVKLLYRERIPEDVDVPDVRLLAKMTPSNEWRLSGEKLIETALESKPNQEFLIVLSCVQHNMPQGFLVYPNAPGVTYKESSVMFSDTPATILGDDMVKVMTEIIQSGELKLLPTTPIHKGLTHMRLGEAAVALGLLKETIVYVLNQVKGKYFTNKQYCNLPLFQNLLVDAATAVYKIESMIYFTSGLQDGYEDPDIEVESILCRIYSTRETVRIINNFLSNMTPFGIQGDLQAYMEDAKSIVYKEQNENLAVYSTLTGMGYAGKNMQDDVRKLRNPSFHPFFTLKRMYLDRKQSKNQPVMSLQLKNYFHQSLMEAADDLEYSVLRISYAVESTFANYGQDVIHEHRDLERISDAVLEVYAMLTSLARGSRSYCIGVQNSNREIMQCLMIGTNGKKIVDKKVTEVAAGKYLNNDEVVKNMAENIIQLQRAPAEHPLTRVFF